MEKLLLRAGTEGEGREGGCRVRGRVGNPGGSRGGGDPSRETIHGKTIILYW